MPIPNIAPAVDIYRKGKLLENNVDRYCGKASDDYNVTLCGDAKQKFDAYEADCAFWIQVFIFLFVAILVIFILGFIKTRK